MGNYLAASLAVVANVAKCRRFIEHPQANHLGIWFIITSMTTIPVCHHRTADAGEDECWYTLAKNVCVWLNGTYLGPAH